jgi:hypothetical protein
MTPTALLLALLTATAAHAQPAPKPTAAAPSAASAAPSATSAAPSATPAAPSAAPSAAAGSTAPRREDPQAARTLFRQLDRNGDGYLSAEELWRPREREDNWAAVDRNRDGRISEDEFTVLRRP